MRLWFETAIFLFFRVCMLVLGLLARMDSRSMEKTIEKCFPGFRVRRSRRILSGWDNTVLEVNGEYVFRFPRFRESEKNLRKELRILPVLSKYLSTRVPKYEFVWKGNRGYPHWFAGYRRIDGIPVTIGAFRKAWTKSLAVELGRFLNELHSLKIPRNRLKSVAHYTPKEWVKLHRLLHSRVKRIVYPLLDRDTRRQTEAFWKRLLRESRELTFDPTLIHGDLTDRNILIDPRRQKLTGIIDWSGPLFSDPAYDFAGLYEINPTLGEKTLEEYKHEKSGFTSRVRWYLNTMAFDEIITGVTLNSEEYRTKGLRHLARRIMRT